MVGNAKYPTVGGMRITEQGHYEQVYRRSRRKSDGLIEAIQRMGVVVVAEEVRLNSGAYKRVTPDGYVGLFEVLNFKITYFGMLRRVEFDLGACRRTLK